MTMQNEATGGTGDEFRQKPRKGSKILTRVAGSLCGKERNRQLKTDDYLQKRNREMDEGAEATEFGW